MKKDRPRGRELQPGETLRPDEDYWDDETDEDDARTSLDIALALAASGTPVFPCRPNKRPACAHGFKDASIDPDRIREMWADAGNAAALVGVPTGPASGIDVLDVDPRNGGSAWKAKNIDRLPETRIHGTPGLPKVPTDPIMPGEHWLFAHAEGVRNGASKVALGIDVRGEGGYVCFPPSPGYSIIHDVEVAEWPDWLLALVLKTTEPTPQPDPATYATPARITDNRLRGFIESVKNRLAKAPDGGRHNARYAAGRSLGGIEKEAGLSETEVEEMLIAVLPPRQEEAKERKAIRDGFAFGKTGPIDLNKLPESAQFRGYQPRGNGAGNGAESPPPTDTQEQLEPDAQEPDPLPLPEGDQDAGPDGQAVEAEDAETGDGQGDAPRELYGPPTEAEFITELAALDEIAFARIAKAKAALLNVDVPTLTKRVHRARSEAKTQAKAEAKAAEREARAKEKAKQLPPLTEAEVAAEIEHLRQLSDAAFYADRPAAALRLRCSPTELTELVRRAKADYARKNATIPPFVTEQDVMRAFVTQFSDDLRFNHSSGSWLVWAEHFWQPDQRKLAFFWSLDLCKQMAPSASDEGRAVVEKVRFSAAVETAARVMPEVATAQEDWDSNPWLLGTPAGVVDLRTGILRPGNRRDMITKTTAVTPAISPDCPTWDAFLDFATHGDDQLVRFMQRYFGYCLTGLTIEEIFLFLFGPGGAGKGTLMETVTHILGDYAGTAPMEVFTGQSWAPTEYYRADMVGKRLIVANEPERGAYWAEAFIKESTGGDTLSGRHPAGRPFRFKPTHKMALSGNHMPRLRGRSTGMERRLRILPFTRKPATADTGLKAKLLAESPAILRWMIEGCLAWQKIGLQPSDAIKAANHRYFEAQDVFGRWIDECCILDRYLQLDPSTLRASFNAWAKANGEDEMTGNAFSEAIDQFDPPETTPPTPPLTRGRTKGKRWVRGIGLKSPEPQPGGRWGTDTC